MSGSSKITAPPLEESRPHREATRPASFAAVPGWLVSGMLHAGVIVFLITSGLPSCGNGQIGTGADSGEFREVGIYIKNAVDSPTPPNETDEETSEEPPQSTNAGPQTTQTAETPDKIASDLIDPPDIARPGVIGQSRGGPAPSGVELPSEALVTPRGVRAPASPGQGPGTVSFMGQTTEAQTIVYVIDTSSSMGGKNAIEYAQAKLKQSINGLNQKQQFQIVSFTHTFLVMQLRNDRSQNPPLYRATRPNLILATQYINGFTPSGGTKHFPALRAAFRFKPDVIFLLTDADEDRLSPKELSEIKTQWNNRGKTHIHCIQFGSGLDLERGTSSFLRTLASQNHGSFTYIDIDKLENP